MPLINPFSTLAVPKELVVEFLGCFARCEYAMKASTYARDDHGIAAAAWQRLANDAGAWVQVQAGTPLDEAIELLTTAPPRLQSFGGGWQAVPLRGGHRLAQAIDAAVRVRHNLFHGGKHAPEAAPGRDAALVNAALVLVTAVVDQCPGDLRDAYNGA
ncbi:hypothetical protein CDN99_15235 [Roseateles aquatilis]|jgi:hypothetical protein|uniref:Apea-like HEPN domain-containing protein n=1 Tax=Roseateles aquatilis TaxID=431061 RepID=A0A246J873_9BURK|nr:hypothetical protein [Roseateles aquatilis]MBY0368234.1 hypothetical protein [Burkholderiaceae bacterium]OWQ88827.1 hypothetical protein CDN99_15235 [Roseateles aquatilis]